MLGSGRAGQGQEGRPSRSEQAERDVGCHAGKVLVGGKNELPVLDRQGRNHEVWDPGVENAFPPEAVLEQNLAHRRRAGHVPPTRGARSDLRSTARGIFPRSARSWSILAAFTNCWSAMTTVIVFVLAPHAFWAAATRPSGRSSVVRIPLPPEA